MSIMVCTYCSYKYSPVGFRLGVFQFDNETCNNEYVVPETDSDISPIIRNCFVEGLIQKVMGKIPQTNEYIILFKGIECDYVNEDGMPSKKYGNFAFLTNDPITYLNLNNNIAALSMLQLSEAMDSFLIPDSNAGDAAIKIDTKRFNDFIVSVSNTTRSIENPNDFTKSDNPSQEFFEVITTYESKDSGEKLHAIFDVNFDIAGNIGTYPKKKLRKKALRSKQSATTKSIRMDLKRAVKILETNVKQLVRQCGPHSRHYSKRATDDKDRSDIRFVWRRLAVVIAVCLGVVLLLWAIIRILRL